jgi:hypothetical protein
VERQRIRVTGKGEAVRRGSVRCGEGGGGCGEEGGGGQGGG